MEILLVVEGQVGIGPLVRAEPNGHKPLVFFRRGRTVVGDYSILLEKPAFATYRAYGQDI
jgi:hypothetical protein